MAEIPMKSLHPQFITDDTGKKLSVVLSIKEYRAIMEELEELEDIRLYDEVKAKNEKPIPLDDYLKESAFAKMIERGVKDSNAGRTLPNEAVKEKIKKWQP
jgi:hypothetical protein